jgi:ATP-binding cassette subfamily B protein
MSAFGASERIFDLLEKPIENLNQGHNIIHNGQIEFKDVFFSYPSRPQFPILKGVSFSISSQETVAIVGPSGSGKSTIVQLLMNFYEPKSGSIFFDQKESSYYSLKCIRSSIGLVSQEPILVSESIMANIRYGNHQASEEEVHEAARKAYAHDFISSFPDGYHTLVGERGVQLSGGQKQRVAIARAILKNPRILVLDEATSSLDAESEHLVQKALDEQMGKRSTIVIAHRLSTVKRADKILVLEDGKIIQVGTHNDLYMNKDGLYHKLVERQFNNQKEQI